MGSGFETIRLLGDGVELIDQRLLPGRLEYIHTRDWRELVQAIKGMAIRGAPALGVAAAFALVLAAREGAAGVSGSRAAGPEGGAGGGPAPAEPSARAAVEAAVREAAQAVRASRPTARNLFWAVERMLRAAEAFAEPSAAGLVRRLEAEAQAVLEEDVAGNRRIGEFGRDLISDGDGVLTHCNAGALATGGYGTALGVIRAAFEQGKRFRVFVDETRPLLQGARLTAWELVQEGIPAILITDNMAAHFMAQGAIDLAVVGADRIAANGDTANKIGTYGVAVLAREHGIPFYVAAPFSTVDLSLKSGREIVIEERGPEEVTTVAGCQVAPTGVLVHNPAFDVTPARYISAIITDRGLVRPPLGENLKRLAQAG
ncbi:MAG: S-methyl-5-thioribose-1-phosphate isomerase [Acetobacteraceae bacterium]|nr:S-methyl-5-thioribose-1-phosphate isomerase [Acetobacteraceae bacterium]